MSPRKVFLPGRAVAIVMVAALAGCWTPRVIDPASPYYDLPAGSTLTLRHDVEIPLGRARAVLQGGRAAAAGGLQRYDAYCELEVDAVSERQPQTVRADVFTITEVWRQQELGAAGQTLRLAALGGGIGLGVGGGRFGLGLQFGGLDNDGGHLVLNMLHLRLKSSAQPQVRELRCATGWTDPASARYPSLVEVRRVLGELASIEPHEPPAKP